MKSIMQSKKKKKSIKSDQIKVIIREIGKCLFLRNINIKKLS